MTVSISDLSARPHDPELVDRLAGLTPQRFEGIIWRATRLNQDPLAFSYNGGRWTPPSTYQSVPVLYTSLERDGAITEMASWLSLLTPAPSKGIIVHQLNVRASDVVTIDKSLFLEFGIDHARYADRTYAKMGEAPPSRTQEIGAALSFLGIDGLVVPSARFPCSNLILFDNLDNEVEVDTQASEEVDWTAYIKD